MKAVVATFLAKQFFAYIVFVLNDADFILVPSCLSGQDASKHLHGDLERSRLKFDLGSRPRGDPSRSIAYDSMRLDDRNTTRPHPLRSLFCIKSY